MKNTGSIAKHEPETASRKMARIGRLDPRCA
jgi:hypothetical protein